MVTIINKFSLRGISFIKGVHLLVEHAIIGKEFDEAKRTFLHSDITEIENRYQHTLKSVEDADIAEIHFYELLKELVEFMKQELNIDENQAFKTLCQAEQFSTWHQGRQDLVTEFPISGFIVKQVDTPFCHLSKNQAEEFLRIQHTDIPGWLKSLPRWAQRYLRSQLNAVKAEVIDQHILTTPAYLRTVPGLANYSLHTLEIKNAEHKVFTTSQRFCAATPIPVQVPHFHERRRLTKQNILQLVSDPVRLMGSRFLDRWQPIIQPGQILPIPVLVQSLLSPIWIDIFAPLFYPQRNESRLLQTKEWAVDRARQKLMSSRGVVEVRKDKTLYRLDPILISTNYPINFLRQETLLIQSKMGKNSKEGMLLIHCFLNFLEDVVLPKLRVVSKTPPSYHEQLFKKLIRTFQPIIRRQSLFFGLNIAFPGSGSQIKRFQRFLNTCLNSLNVKHFGEKRPEAIKQLTAAFTPEQIHDIKLILNAVKDYIVLFNTVRKWKHNKEIFVSALEEIITEKIGGVCCGSSITSCHRKSMQTLQVDAMLIYYQQYGLLPIYNDLPIHRRRFVEIFVSLFLTQHQQKRGGQNAPGAEGISEIMVLPFIAGMYMVPKDIVKEISKRSPHILKECARLARISQPSDPFSLMFRLRRQLKSWIKRFSW